MALDSKKSNLTKGLKNAPVFRPSGTLSKKLSFYTPNFSTVTGVSQGSSPNTEAALAAPATPSNTTGGAKTETVAPASFLLMLGYSVQAAVTQSIKTVFSTDSGSTWTTFESDFDLQYVPVGGQFQRDASPNKKYVKPGDNLWIGVYSLSGSVSSSIKFEGNPGGYIVSGSTYDSLCGITNPYKIYNISGSSSIYFTGITIAVVSGSVVAC